MSCRARPPSCCSAGGKAGPGSLLRPLHRQWLPHSQASRRSRSRPLAASLHAKVRCLRPWPSCSTISAEAMQPRRLSLQPLTGPSE